MKRKQHVSERAMRVVARLSRDRWLSPEDVRHLCLAFEKKWPQFHAPGFRNYTLPWGWHYIGVLRGECPLPWARSYAELAYAAKGPLNPRRRSRRDSCAAELRILELQLRSAS